MKPQHHNIMLTSRKDVFDLAAGLLNQTDSVAGDFNCELQPKG